MAWVEINGRSYYRRSRRVGGKVRTQYYGAGFYGQVAAVFDAEMRELEDEKRALMKAEWDRVTADGRASREGARALGLVAGVAMEAAGFHRQNRGPWRRRRGTMSATTDDAANDGSTQGEVLVADDGTPLPTLPASLEEMRAVARRAQKGDKSALPALRRYFETHLDLMIGVCGGDVAEMARETMLDRMCPRNPARRMAIHMQISKLRVLLAGDDPSPLVQLLAEQVAHNWVDHNYWMAVHNDAMIGAKRDDGGGGIGLRLHAHYQRMIDAAHRRYMASVRTLATVRKLDVQVVQIIGQNQQINLGG